MPAMRQRRRRAFGGGTGGDGQDSAWRVPARIRGTPRLSGRTAAVRVLLTATIDGFSFTATIDGFSFADGIGVSVAAAVVRVSASTSATAATTGVSAGVAAGTAAWIHPATASRQGVRKLGEHRRRLLGRGRRGGYRHDRGHEVHRPGDWPPGEACLRRAGGAGHGRQARGQAARADRDRRTPSGPAGLPDRQGGLLAGGSRVLPISSITQGITLEQADALVAQLRNG